MTTETFVAPAWRRLSRSSPEPDSPERPLAGWLVAGALAVLVLVSLYLRTRALHVNLWVDEGISIGIAGHPLSQIPHLLREDGSPPLYYVLLHFWMQAFGHGVVATHVLSLIFALLAIPVAFWAGVSLFDRRAGLICAGLAAGVPYLTEYAQETRMYSLMALLSLVTAAAFVEVYVNRRRRVLPIFVIGIVGVLYTHNWGLFLAPVTFVAFLVCVWRVPHEQRRALAIDGLIGFGVAALLFLPWLPTVIYQAQHTGAPWDLPPVLWSLSQGTYFIVGGRGAAVALLLAGGTGLLALRSEDGARATRLTLVAISLLVLFAGTLLLAWLYAKTTPAWAPRYLAVVVGPGILLFGLGLSRAGRLGIAAMVLIAGFWLLDPQPTTKNYKEDAATALAQVKPHITPGSLVLSTQPEQVPVLSYYLPRYVHFATPLGPVSDPGVMDWRNALARFRDSRVRNILLPELASVHPGQRVVLITPLNLTKQPLWMVLINRSSRVYTRILEHDSRFRRVAFSSPDVVSGLAVRVSVYLRTP